MHTLQIIIVYIHTSKSIVSHIHIIFIILIRIIIFISANNFLHVLALSACLAFASNFRCRSNTIITTTTHINNNKEILARHPHIIIILPSVVYAARLCRVAIVVLLMLTTNKSGCLTCWRVRACGGGEAWARRHKQQQLRERTSRMYILKILWP